MSISSLVLRVAEYRRRHGVPATLRRAGVALNRALFAADMVVFYCDLDRDKLRPVRIPTGFSIECDGSLLELSSSDFQQVTAFWNPGLASANIRERFERGALLWMVKAGDRVAAYGWTLRGRTIQPYYFPLGINDVQLFDFYVAPKFRGRALHWLLTSHILHQLAAQGASRAFADTGAWNDAQLASFTMTPFRELGRLRTFRIIGRVLTCWRPSTPLEEPRIRIVQTRKAPEALRSNE
jgi:GNAT superfamily N-acetyltransferase